VKPVWKCRSGTAEKMTTNDDEVKKTKIDDAEDESEGKIVNKKSPVAMWLHLL
jgi:hypothetical protein